MNRTEWKMYELGDVVTLQRGFDLPSRERMPGTVPVVSSSGVCGYHDTARVKGPGVVTGRCGTLGKVFYLENAFWPLNTSLFVRDFKGNIPRFIAYMLETLGINRLSSASAVPGVDRNVLHRLRVTIPPVSVQKRIAQCISTLDELIENNLCRIAILEEMARAIYHEWFVEFRYPGRGSEPLVESEAGPIPRDWHAGPTGSLVETMGGGTPSTSRPEYWEDGNITWYTPSDLTANGTMFITSSSRKITEQGLRSSSARLFPPYSVMMTSRATIGVVSIATTEACTNQGFITCIPNDRISSYHLYFWLLDNRQRITGLASGATFKEINKTVFRQLPIAVPPREAAEAFVRVVDPVAKLNEALLRQNLALRNTRDLLLPRLISGELDVSSITIDAEEDNL